MVLAPLEGKLLLEARLLLLDQVFHILLAFHLFAVVEVGLDLFLLLLAYTRVEAANRLGFPHVEPGVRQCRLLLPRNICLGRISRDH